MTPASLPLPRPGERWALFLDVDGTLLELVATPDQTEVAPPVLDLLERLRSSLDTAVALVSGRSLDTLDRLFEPLRLPAAGLHGLERRSAHGGIVREEVPAAPLAHARAVLGDLAEKNPGLMLEDKGSTLALHYRQAPSEEETVHEHLHALARELGEPFHVQTGKMVAEIKSRAACKGRSIAAFLEEEPFAGRIPVFVGDDRTDEDGFATVNERGGISVRVGDGAPTRARFRIASVAELRTWLERVAAASLEAPAEASARARAETTD